MARRTQISFSTFNLYNLNRPNKRMYRNTSGLSEEEYSLKVAWSARALKETQSRIWGFQELWDNNALTDVFQKADLLDKYDLIIPQNHSGKSIICAGAVEKGLLNSEPVWVENFHPKFILQSSGDDAQTAGISIRINKFSRPVLKFKIKPHAKSEITVYVVHLKSKNTTRIERENWYSEDSGFYKHHCNGLGQAISTIRRAAEAAALRMYLIEELKGTDTPIVVLGDINDGQYSNTLNILTGQPNYILSGLTEGGSDTGLYSTGELQQLRSLKDVYYTHIYQNAFESLDHILVSQEFYDNSKKRVWAFKDLVISNDHLNNENYKKTGGTDHGVVTACFEYRPK
jgi:endonuclease/exonuclease/phosphatase family metal-dependent hydrolase